jgi:hypothetical protein
MDSRVPSQRFVATSYQNSITSYQLPVISYQLSVTGENMQATGSERSERTGNWQLEASAASNW